eukprot:403375027
MAFEYIIIGYVYVIATRLKVFNRRFLRQFDEVHQEAFGKDKKTPQWGYPDTGNGWFAQKLPYKDWYEFNCAQRVHLNFLESFAFVALVSLVAGIVYPDEAFLFQMIYILGRFIFTYAYWNMGPIYRIPGVILLWIGQIANLYYAIKTCLALVE